jgi:diguanylate cyclase (GGDEF)-like protein
LKKPILVENVDTDPKFKKLGLKEEGFYSLAALPIMVKEQVMGVISIGNRAPSEFLDRDIRLLEAIANQIGMAIENAQLYEETVQLAFTDGLTGLYNRRYLMEQIEREYLRARRGHYTFSVIMIDLDGLKTINDNFGHREGDTSLREVAEVIKYATRASDVAARWGGDEFVVITPETDNTSACRIGERIRAEIEKRTLQLDGREATISVSVGVASYPVNASDVTELLHKADEAVYDAKNLGKNRVCQSSHLLTSNATK